jgi:hypothetical protein
MKKSFVFFVSAVASAVVLFMTSCANPLSGGLEEGFAARILSVTQVLRTAPDLFNYDADGYNSSVGPISITQGFLGVNGTNTPVYLVSLSGTRFVSNQATGIINDLQAGFGIEGAYVTAVRNAIESSVPKNANLILSGHSLGGMVAQQVAGDGTIKNDYTVLNTVCFGAPLITFIWREGAVQRLGDTNDIIPTLSISSLFLVTGIWNIWGLNLHSYGRSDVWGSYSAFGYKYQNVTIGLYSSTRKWFAAPAGMYWRS